MILHFGEVFWYFISLFEGISLCLDHLFGEGRFQQGMLKVAPLGSSRIILVQIEVCYGGLVSKQPARWNYGCSDEIFASFCDCFILKLNAC